MCMFFFKDCSPPDLGIARSSIPDSDITASSELDQNSKAYHARLGYTKAWVPGSNDKHPWIQVNLQYRRNITAITTQGFQPLSSYVKSYYVSYGDDGVNWMNYTVQGTIKVRIIYRTMQGVHVYNNSHGQWNLIYLN